MGVTVGDHIKAYRMLPIPQGSSQSKWGSEWLESIYEDTQSILEEDDLQGIRARNERFGAYLVTITNLKAAYTQKLDELVAEFNARNPRPQKGVTEWREARDLYTATIRHTRDWLAEMHEDIATRHSGGQSAQKSLTSEVNHGVSAT